VGFPEDERPTVIQLEGNQDTIEFWTQPEAIDELQNQLYAAVAEDVPQQLPERPAAPPAVKSSMFSRRQNKTVVTKAPKPYRPPVTVEVQLDEAHFRSETEYGLYETLRGRAVLVTVVVR
jgi:hypothetical protein